MFDQFMSLLAALNANVLWGIPMVVLMIGTGAFLLVVTRGVVFARFNVVMRYTTKTLFRRPDKSELEQGAISPFQAVCTALAATLGTGNIVGVALAVATGGPGAIFWLWLSALAGMVIKFWRGHAVGGVPHAQRARRDRGRPHVLHLPRPRSQVARGALRHLRVSGVLRHRGERAGQLPRRERQRDVRHSSPRHRRRRGVARRPCPSSAASGASRRSPSCSCPSPLSSTLSAPPSCSSSTRPRFPLPSP